MLCSSCCFFVFNQWRRQDAERAKMSFQLNQELCHTFYDGMEGGIVIIEADEAERILFVNRAVPKLYGYESEEAFYQGTGGLFAGMVRPKDAAPLSTHVHQGGGYSTWYYRIPVKGGTDCSAVMLIHEDMRDGVKIYLCQIFTEQAHDRSIAGDDLTGLPGVRDFTRAMVLSLQAKRNAHTLGQYCCVYFNITNFRTYNQVFGVLEGDSVIREIAQILRKTFPDGFLGHLSADNFAAIIRQTKAKESIPNALNEINQRIRYRSVEAKAGIFLLEEDSEDEILRTALDRARLACDSISLDATKSVAVYSSKMQEETEKRAYILNRFESALTDGSIHVYYQPVVRTLSGRLCGFEALARWEDPDKGMISPGEFVPLLEGVHLIGKLDAYIIENVCRLLHERLQNGHRILPVSVNLSKLDFELIHPLELICRLMDQYNLPRESIHVEITESVMTWDHQKLAAIIKGFHDAGFEVWLDDFGSEYSSLNALHYFQFDVLKIDMEFFRNFDERGRKIIRSVVMMAKSLGIQTLAEGVEDAQQLEFLKSIDCGRIQGWYYGKAEPFAVTMEQMTRKGITMESALDRKIYSRVDLVNTVTEKPVAIFTFDGTAPRLLTANEAYMSVLRTTGTLDQKSANTNLDSGAWGPQKKICSFLNKVFDGTAHSITYADNGQYIMASAEKIAGTRKKWYGRASLVNISEDDRSVRTHVMDDLSRNVIDIFDGVYYLDYRNDALQVITSIHENLSEDRKIGGIENAIRTYTKSLIHVDDKARFLAFMNKERLCKAAKDSGRSEATGLFRVRRPDGRYHWSVFHAIVFFKHESRDVMLLEREDIWERQENREEMLDPFVASFPEKRRMAPVLQEDGISSEIFEAMRHAAALKFFWVDRSGKVCGVSDAFASYSGMAEEKVEGKTGKTVPFFVDVPRLVDYEKEVIRSGREITTACSVIRNGLVQEIRLTGIPYYEGNECAGIVCVVTDSEEILAGRKENITDPVTGFLNFRGILLSGAQFDEANRLNAEEYCVLECAPEHIEQLSQQYGGRFTEKLAEIIAESLRQSDLTGIAVGRTQGCTFVLFTRISNLERMMNAAGNCEKAVESLTDVDGIPCRIELESGIAYGTEGADFFEILQISAGRMRRALLQGTGPVFSGEQVLVDMGVLDSTPEQVVIIDPASYHVLFMNRAMRQCFGFSSGEDLSAKTCHEILNGTAAPCKDCRNSTLTKDHVTCWSRRWMGEKLILNRDFLIPYHGGIAVMSVGIPISDYISLAAKDSDLLLQENDVNETIETGIFQSDAGEAIQATLRGIGHNLMSERVLILERTEKGALSCTGEWHEEGLVPVQGEMQGILAEKIEPLTRQFDNHRVVLIPDYEAFCKENPRMQVPMSGIRNIISGQLLIGGKPQGFTFVVNSSEETFRRASLLLLTLTDFLAVLLRTESVQKKLEERSLTDEMTGVGNRESFDRYMKTRVPGQSVVLISCDIMGLDTINSLSGYEAGDGMIQKTAAVLLRFADRSRIFRIDGDEFFVAEEDMDDAGAKILIRRIREETLAQGIRLSFGCAVHSCKDPDFNGFLRELENSRLRDRAHQKTEHVDEI